MSRRLISYLQPAQNKDLLTALQDKKITALGMDCIPRTIRQVFWDTGLCLGSHTAEGLKRRSCRDSMLTQTQVRA